MKKAITVVFLIAVLALVSVPSDVIARDPGSTVRPT